MTRHAFLQKLQHFLDSKYTFEHYPGKANNKFVKFLSSDVVPTEESDELLCTAWSLVMVRNQLPTTIFNAAGSR